MREETRRREDAEKVPVADFRGNGILIGKLKQIKTKFAEKLKEIWDLLPSFFTENCDFAAFF